jgi:hypothetical protein
MVRHSISQLGKSWKIHGFAGSMLKAPPRVFASSNVGFFVGTAIVSHPETNPFLWDSQHENMVGVLLFS